MIVSTFGTQAELIFGEAVILSCDGFNQGDPLACLLFALVLHPIIMKISSEIPELLLNGWFLDDGALMGKVEDLSRAGQEGPARGLFLSTSATTFYVLAVVAQLILFLTLICDISKLGRLLTL